MELAFIKGGKKDNKTNFILSVWHKQKHGNEGDKELNLFLKNILFHKQSQS